MVGFRRLISDSQRFVSFADPYFCEGSSQLRNDHPANREYCQMTRLSPKDGDGDGLRYLLATWWRLQLTLVE
jgi:hypothetical protein